MLSDAIGFYFCFVLFESFRYRYTMVLFCFLNGYFTFLTVSDLKFECKLILFLRIALWTIDMMSRVIFMPYNYIKDLLFSQLLIFCLYFSVLKDSYSDDYYHLYSS